MALDQVVLGFGTIGTVVGSVAVYNVGDGFSVVWVFFTLFFMLVSFILFCICCALENQRKDEEQRRKNEEQRRKNEEQRRKDEEQRRKNEEQRRKNEEQRRQKAEVQLQNERDKCLVM